MLWVSLGKTPAVSVLLQRHKVYFFSLRCLVSCAMTAARAGLAAVNDSFALAGKIYLVIFF